MSSNIFYLTNNKQVGEWNDGELRLLCKALRFPEDLIVSYASQSFVDGKLSTKKLHDLTQNSGFFRLLDTTFNNHSADWNAAALVRSIDLIEGRITSFSELHTIYLAYATFELVNMTGVPAEVEALLPAFKLCGKTISPAKLQHRLKHAKPTHIRRNTLQFHEFLNLMLWTLPDNFPASAKRVSVKDRNSLGLYDIDQPTSYLVPPNERVHRDLDMEYVKDEMSYKDKKVKIGPLTVAERIEKKEDFKDATSALMVSAGISEDIVIEANRAKAVYSQELAATDQEVRQVAAGFEHTRHISKEWLVREITPKPPSQMSFSDDIVAPSHEKAKLAIPELNAASATEMYEILQAYMRERQRRLQGVHDLSENIDEREREIRLDRRPSSLKKGPLMEPLVTDDDIAETKETISTSKTEFAFMQREKLLNEPEVEQSVKKEDRRTLEELIEQLHNPPPLRFQGHDQQCDSKKRNIGQLKQPGIHYLLTEPSYERSNKGQLFSQLHNQLTNHGKFRSRGVRIHNKDIPEVIEENIEEVQQPYDNGDILPQGHLMRDRIGSLSQVRTPLADSWMAPFTGPVSNISFNTDNLESYYWRKMEEFGVSVPGTKTASPQK